MMSMFLQMSIAFCKHQVTKYADTHACPVRSYVDASI